MAILEAADHPGIFTSHAYPEQTAGEIRMNYATAGRADLPALVLVPAQSQSWWSYQDAMPLLAEGFRVYAVDLRRQGRSMYTHHFRGIDPASGALMGAASDGQVARARDKVTKAGQPFQVISLPEMAHSMHGQDPHMFTGLLADWARQLDTR